MLLILNLLPKNCSVSVFIFTKVALSGKSVVTEPNTGAKALQGPHHGAQKSTITGISELLIILSIFSELPVMILLSRSDFLQFPQFAFL